ncbi:MAG: DUF2167 domain-containing protein [Myxococcota bacterium]
MNKWVLVWGMLAVPVGALAQDEGPKLDVTPGPITGALGNIASLEVPEGYGFVNKGEMATLNRLTGNLHNPNDVGALLSADGWMVFFSFQDIGYVKDDDRDELDPSSMMSSMRESEEAANVTRKQQGFPQLTLIGWQTEPFYDEKTQNLTWAIKNRSEGSEGIGVNHEVRLLGRHGVMSATLVAGSEELPAAVPKLNSILAGFSFNAGQTYAEYVQGDKIAEYGLAGLVLGGGVLLAAKTGLLGYLGKFIKFIVLGVAAAFAGIVRMFKGKSAEQA